MNKESNDGDIKMFFDPCSMHAYTCIETHAHQDHDEGHLNTHNKAI